MTQFDAYRLEFYPVAVSTSSAVEMLPLADAKLHLRIDHSSEDDLISALIATALGSVENMTNRILRPGTYYLYSDSWHSQVFNFGPITQVDAVDYFNEQNVLTTVPADTYWIDLNSTPARINFSSPPTHYPDRFQSIRITAQCGEATLPAQLRQAILLLVGHYYENRQAVVTGPAPSELPLAIHHLTNPFRLWQ